MAFVKAFFDAGKPVSAICHGPWTVIEAGAAPRPQDDELGIAENGPLECGRDWVDQEVVVDGNLVTSRKPADLAAFSREDISLIAAGAAR